MYYIRGIEVKFLGATNTQGSRIKLYDFMNNESVIIKYDYSLNCSTDIAEKYLKEKGISINGCVVLKDTYILTTNNQADKIK